MRGQYSALASECGFNANLRRVATPFIGEDHAEAPQAKPCGDGLALYCPACRNAFPMSESISDEQHRAAMKKLAGTACSSVSCDPPTLQQKFNKAYDEKYKVDQPAAPAAEAADEDSISRCG